MRMNLDKISPVKRAKVERGIGLIEQVNAEHGRAIDRMIIFGSAATDRCDEESDIDVCLVSDCEDRDAAWFNVYGGLGIVMDDLVDVFKYKDTGDRLRSEIQKKGVTVYEYS